MTHDEIKFFINTYFKEKNYEGRTFETSPESEQQYWVKQYADKSLMSMFKLHSLGEYNSNNHPVQPKQAPIPKPQKKVVVINA